MKFERKHRVVVSINDFEKNCQAWGQRMAWNRPHINGNRLESEANIDCDGMIVHSRL